MNRYRFDESQHLHLLDEKPLTGCSTIVSVLAKNLTWWAAELAAVECLESGEKIETIRAEYEEAAQSPDKKKAIDLLQKKYPIFKKARYAHYTSKNKSAKKGTDLHAELERFIKEYMLYQKEKREDLDYKKYPIQIIPFIEWTSQYVERFLWSEAHSYDEDTFTGGISDAGAILKNGSVCVFDFKSAKFAYQSSFIQGGGYCHQIRKNGLFDKDGKSLGLPLVFPTHIAIVPFGTEPVIPVIRHCEQYEVAFKCAVELFRIMGMSQE